MSRVINYDSDFLVIKEGNTRIAEIKYKIGIPSQKKFCNLKDYFVLELVNPYFNNNNDVVSIFLDGKKDQIGYIFPLQTLDSEDLCTNKWEQISLYVAAQWIINCKDIVGKNSFLDIYNIDNEKLRKGKVPLLLVINMKELKSFDIKKYYLSLLLCGYTERPFFQNLKNISRADFFFNKKTKIFLYNTQSIYQEKLDEIFFSELLDNNNLPAFQYLVTYQCFELLMKKQKETEINEIKTGFPKLDLTDFKTLRDFKKTIQVIDKEKELIAKMFSDVKLLDRFNEDRKIFESLYDSIICDSDANTVYLKLYMVRNSLFHYYRNFFGNVDFDRLLFYSYQMLIELFISKFKE